MKCCKVKLLFLTGIVLFVLLLSGCVMDVEGTDENDREAADAFMQEYVSEHQNYFQVLYGEGEVYSISRPITEYQLEGWHTDRFLGALSPFPYYLKSNMAAFGPVKETGIIHFIVYAGEEKVETYRGTNAVGVVSIVGEDHDFRLATQLEPIYVEMLMASTERLQSYLKFEGMDENQPMGFFPKLNGLVFTTSQRNGYASLSTPGSIKRTRDLAVTHYRVRSANRVNAQSDTPVMVQTVVYQSTHYSVIPFWSTVIGIPIVLLLIFCLLYRRTRRK